MKKISVKGALIGSVTDIVSTNILMGLIMVALTGYYSSQGMSQESITELFSNIHEDKGLLYVLSMVIGAFCLMLGGFVSALIAKKSEVLNGTLASVFCLSGNIYSLFITDMELSITDILISIFISPLFAMIGGWIRMKQKSLKTETAA